MSIIRLDGLHITSFSINKRQLQAIAVDNF